MTLTIASAIVSPLEERAIIANVFAVLRVAFGIMSGDMRLVNLLNLMYSLVVSFRHLYFSTDCTCSTRGQTIILWECYTLISLGIGVATIRKLMTAESRLLVESQTARDEHRAATSLLDTICDAVVELNSSLSIVGSCSRFACLVLNAPHRCLDGTAFEKFVAERDRAAFARNMVRRPNVETMNLANMFHLTLQDGLRNQIRVEVFHVPITRNGEGHLLGVREFGESSSKLSLSQPASGEGRQGGSNTNKGGEAAGIASPSMGVDVAGSAGPNGEAGSSCKNSSRALHCRAEAPYVCCDERRRVLTIGLDPRTNKTRVQCPHHSQFWGEILEAKASVKAAYSLCVETFALHHEIDSMDFGLREVWRVNSRSEGLRGARAECEMKLEKEMGSQDQSDANVAVITAVAIVSRASLASSDMDGSSNSLEGDSNSRAGSCSSSGSSSASSTSSRSSRGSSRGKAKHTWRASLDTVSEKPHSARRRRPSKSRLAQAAVDDQNIFQEENAQQRSGEELFFVQVKQVTFDPNTDEVIDVCAGIPPRQITWRRPAHFWINVGDASASVKKTFSKCVDIFERNPALKHLNFSLKGVRCTAPRGGVPTSCKISLTRAAAGLSRRPKAKVKAVAVLVPASSYPATLQAKQHVSDSSDVGDRQQLHEAPSPTRLEHTFDLPGTSSSNRRTSEMLFEL